jgi:hypothetical protein
MCIHQQVKLTTYMERSYSWKVDSCSAGQEITHYMKPNGYYCVHNNHDWAQS